MIRRCLQMCEDLREAGVPCDGVVAISNDSMVQYKIKTHLTVDLRKSGLCMYLSDDQESPVVVLSDDHDEDGIYELTVRLMPASPLATDKFQGRHGIRCTSIDPRSSRPILQQHWMT